MGPITISVVDPVEIKGEIIQLFQQPVKKLQGLSSYENWTVLNGNDTLVSSSKSIDVGVDNYFQNMVSQLNLTKWKY